MLASSVMKGMVFKRAVEGERDKVLSSKLSWDGLSRSVNKGVVTIQGTGIVL